MEFLDKNALVCGIAKSGIAGSLLLKKLGANVTIQDIRENLDFEQKELFKKENINTYLGQNPTKDFIDKFDLMVLSPGISSDLDFVKYAKKKIPVISEVELAYLKSKAPIIAITGTNGKTTTTTLMAEIVKKFNSNVETVGNIGTPFSEKVLKLNEDGFFIAEISSFQLENIVSFKPKVSIVLNVSPDHLNRHKTFENYIKAKERIFENQTESDFLILNYDDEICLKMANKTKAQVIYFSCIKNENAQIFLHNEEIYTNFNKTPKKFLNINELKILGIHNIQNIMSCILASHSLNIPLYIVKEVIKKFNAIEHRNEYVLTINNVDYYNDSKGTNPDSSIKAILSMKKPIHLIAGGYDKNSDFTHWIQTFKNRVKSLILIGECKEKIAKYCKENNFFDYKIVDSLEDAVKTCYSNSKSGDCVLLSPACASWDMFKDYEERGNLFKKYVFDLRGDNFNV